MFRLAEGEEDKIRKISSVVSDAYFDRESLAGKAVETVNRLFEEDPDKLYGKHTKSWEKFWDSSDVIIKGKDCEGYNSQQVIRLAVYHLIRAKARDEDRGLICPKGLLSEVYSGSIFWDMEIFIQPFYIYTYPEAARATHMFRYLNLPAARSNAESYDYKGARYPWQSDYKGGEATPEELSMAFKIAPLARFKPGFGAAGILQFLLCWNEFQFASTLTTGNKSRTLPLALYYFKSQFGSNYGVMFAATIIIIIPSIIVYILFQEQVVSGLATGAVKG